METAAHPITAETLLDPVRRATGRATLAIGDWSAAPVAYADFDPISGGVARFSGVGRDHGVEVPWSLILKAIRAPRRPPEASAVDYEDPADPSYWEREVLAYRSGLLAALPGAVVAPQCFGITTPEPHLAWLWLEDVHDAGGAHWALADYGRAARHLGQFNGAYLTQRSLPAQPWLCRGWLRRRVDDCARAVAGLPDALSHPLVRRAYPGTAADHLSRLWAEREVLLDALDRLPQVFCHGDATRHNLFLRQAPDGREQLAAIDWAFVGLGPVGGELPELVGWSAFAEGELDAVRALDTVAFATYVEGLGEAGWRGDPRIVRLGHTTTAALRLGLLMARYWGIAVDERAYAWAEQAFGCSVEELMDRVAVLLEFLLTQTEEARTLMRSLN